MLKKHSSKGKFDDNNKKRRNGDLIIENGNHTYGWRHSSDTASDPDYDEMPENEEIERRFSALVDNIDLSADRALELKSKPVSLKWKMIQGQDAMQEGKRSARFYLDQLERHLQPQLYVKNPSKKMLRGIINVELLLTSLEVDLRASPDTTWLREFIDEPNCGFITLLKFLNHVQQYVSGSTTPNGTPRKKTEILFKDSYDEHLCLLCMKAISKNKYGFQSILNAPRSLSTMAKSLRLNNTKTRTTVLKLFTLACEQPSGHDKVMKAMDDYKMYSGEKYRYEGLVLSIMTRPSNPSYQETVLKFLNAVIIHAPSSNLRVYHQQEIENAGFNADIVEETLDGCDSISVKKQLSIWKENYIDVATVMDEFVTLRGRTVILREEVDLLQVKNEEIQKEKQKIAEEKDNLEARVEDFKLRALELQANIESLKKHRQEKNGKSDEVTNALEDAIDDILNTAEPPPPPPIPTSPFVSLPPAPPPPVSTFTRNAEPCRLPTLNWAPIMVAGEKSIFKGSDNFDSLQNLLDLREFEKKFELKRSKEQESMQIKRNEALLKLSSKITLLSSNKARNLVITKRRIGKPAAAVQESINCCDLVSLPAEHAELLLKFVPTKDELAGLAKNAKDYDKFAEAEQFLFQMAKVERYEAKLSVMAYIGLFDELYRNVLPRINSILSAATSIMSSAKLKRIFEVILLLGNHMNGSRRGYAQGFKLESLTKLQDTKSNDRQITFLHYLVQIMESKFPEDDNFYEDFDLDDAKKVSFQMLATDVQSLRKGLDLTKVEKEKQPNNFVIYNFYNRAIHKVQRVGERYRRMDEAYKDVCAMFGESSKTKEPSEFFPVFIDFAEQYKKAKRENANRIKGNKTTVTSKNITKSQKKVAHEAASVARKRMSATEVELKLHSNQTHEVRKLTNNDMNGNILLY